MGMIINTQLFITDKQRSVQRFRPSGREREREREMRVLEGQRTDYPV